MSRVAPEEPVGVVDVVGLRPCHGQVAATGRARQAQRGGPAAGSTARGRPPPAPGRCPSSRARTARSCRMVRSASPCAPVRYWARASSSQRRSRSGAARTISWARGRTSRARPPRSWASSAAPRHPGAAPPDDRPRGGGRPLREVREGPPAPQLERLLQQERRPVGLAERRGARGPGHLRLEPLGVHVVGGDGEAVAVARGLDGLGAQRLAEPDDARLQVLGGRRRGCRPRARPPARRRSPAAPAGRPGPGVRHGRADRDVPSRPRPTDRGPGCPRRHRAPAVGRASTARIPDGYRAGA